MRLTIWAMMAILVVLTFMHIKVDHDAKIRCKESGGTWVAPVFGSPYCITVLEELGRKTIQNRDRGPSEPCI